MAARKLENVTDFDDQQLDALANNDNGIDANTLQEMQHIRQDMAAEMSKAKMEGILNDKDYQELQRELDSSSSDKKAIDQAVVKVKSVIGENKKLIDNFVSRLTGEKNIDQKIVVEDHIKLFKNFSLQEKRDYLNEVSNSRDTLKSKLAWVETLYQAVSKYAPDQVDAFRRMNNVEKKAFAENLEKKAKNAEKYEKLITEQGALFSEESKKEWMTKFKDLNVKEQETWIAEFGKETQNKKSIAAKFEAFPSEIRGQFESDFNKGRSKERQVILQNMMRAMEEKHLGVLNGDPNAKHFSQADRAETMKWWGEYTNKFRTASKPEDMKAAMDVLNAMLKGLPDNLKKTAEISKKYEAMEPAVLKLDVQQKLGFTDFYNLNFEQKTKAIEAGEKIKESTEQLTTQYKGKLDDAVKNKYMSAKTRDEFMKEFSNDCSFTDKQKWDQQFETSELAKRKKITVQFQEEVPKDVQEANKDFYELGYSDRAERLGKLLGVDAAQLTAEADEAGESNESSEKTQKIERLSNDATRLEREGSNAASKEDKKEKWGRAIQMYGKILDLDPDDEIAAAGYDRLVSKFTKTFPNEGIPAMADDEDEMTDREMDEALDKAARGTVMQEQRKRLTIAKGLNDLAAKSELLNANTFDSKNKKGRFDNEFDRALNEQLAEHTGGEKILNRDGKAQQVQNVDVKNITKAETNDIFKLQKEVTKNRGEKSTKADHIQMRSRETGQIQNSKTAAAQIENLEDQIQTQAAERAAQSLKGRGQDMNQEQLKALKKRAANTNMEVELQQAS